MNLTKRKFFTRDEIFTADKKIQNALFILVYFLFHWNIRSCIFLINVFTQIYSILWWKVSYNFNVKRSYCILNFANQRFFSSFMILDTLHSSDCSLSSISHILSESVMSFSCGKTLLQIEFCLSKVQIFKGECLLMSFNCLLQSITKTIKIRWTRHAGHCWRSRDKLISDVL